MAERFQNLGEGKIEGRKLDPRTVIVRKGFNYRDLTSEAAQKHIAWLKESIKAEGVEQPIRVQYIGGEVYLVDGQCRLEACKQLYKEGVKVPYKGGGYGPPLIPALTVDSKNEADILAASMVANGSLPPTKIEFGTAADRLQKLGWPVEKIALYIPAHIGYKGAKASRYVKEAVELHQAPTDVRKAATDGVDGVRLSDAAALKIARENPLDPKPAIAEEVSKAKAKGKTTATRPKGAGVATKAKAAEKKTIEQCLKLADALADVALDLTLERTRGPWRRGKNGGSVVSDAPVPEVGGSEHTEYYGGHLIAESIAEKNIPIIAAAPEMYAALVRIRKTLLDAGGNPMPTLDAVIAKAEGR